MRNLKEALAEEGIFIPENAWSQNGSTYYLKVDDSILVGAFEDLVELAVAMGPQQDLDKVYEIFKSGRVRAQLN